MKIELLDVIHYYLGCRFQVEFTDGEVMTDMLQSVSYGNNELWGLNGLDIFVWDEKEEVKSIKLILKHPTDMPKEQREIYKSLCHKVRDSDKSILHISDTPASIFYAIFLGYDAFGLIENGYAIDEATTEFGGFKKLIIKQPTNDKQH